MASIRSLRLCLLMLPAIALGDLPPPDSLVRITPERIPMDPKIATLCDDPKRIIGPHDSPTIHLYVNQQVIDYRKQNPDKFRYPVGSVFFKEKYSDAGKATMATIMTKIADNNKVEDWKFETIKLPSRELVKKDTTSCSDCHDGFEKRGFVSKVTEDSLMTFLKPPAPPKDKAAGK